ncbi:hypothetical protein CFOL_v3_14596 [Cephalotus follicularis]|uniref:F-box/LRR-repeat protein 15-like leucin rich repeat domain-containing protein n=1 Tax=Cephalotus follicularis TaxID=3775 RepID=A0A1Q3BT75_CEPFO|nr:hypothetical protein CFOL_v3_14596 [Cephalotus follicularis]
MASGREIQGEEMFDLDLNKEGDDAGIGLALGFRPESDPFFELDPEVESIKRRRYSVEEKGKTIISHNAQLNLEDKMDIDSNNNGIFILHNFMDVSLDNDDKDDGGGGGLEEERRQQALLRVMEQVSRRKAESKRQHETAIKYAQNLAHHGDLSPSKQEKKKVFLNEKAEEDSQNTPFSIAMEMIKKRSNPYLQNKSFEWVPKGCNLLKKKREAPSLLDISLHVLAKNSEALVSLELVPDVLRHKLSQAVSDNGRMSSNFVQLLARGSATQIRIKGSSCLTEEDFAKIFGSCDTKDLTLLQLDLCGHCMPDHVLHDTLARSSGGFPTLVSISLKGAYRLSDIGLRKLAESAPALQSINLSQCSFLTSEGIINLSSFFESTLRELYIDECQNIDAMLILPALKKAKCLEVLSVAGIWSVCDDFVIGIVEECGINMKELVLANCVALTDISIEAIGKSCSRLCALDISNLHNLTDSAIRFLANGCRSIRRLKLCHNGFSDEAIAACMEVAGQSLIELSLNNISEVGLNTALSLAKCSRNLLSLDLSWCRKLSDEAVGLIVDSCLSLRLLKVFGCTQLTDMFLNEHSNSQVQIIGLKMMPLLKNLAVLEPQEAPLRYPPA